MGADFKEGSTGSSLAYKDLAHVRNKFKAITEREILRVVATIPFRAEENNTLSAARSEALRWAAKRTGQPVPTAGLAGGTFEILSAGRTILAVNVEVEDGVLWSLKADDPDKNVPGRVWSTEVTLRQGVSNEVFLGVRLLVNSAEQELKIEPAVPGLVLQIADRCEIFDGNVRVSPEAHLVENDQHAQQFLDWLGSMTRKLPVVVASGDERSPEPELPQIDTYELAKGLCGLAHVVVLPAHATYALTEKFGKSLSTFHGAVRIYEPGFSALDDPFDHRLYFSQAVRDNPASIASDIRNLVARSSLRRTRLGRDILPFATIRSIASRQEQERQHSLGASDSDRILAADRRNAAIEQENETLKGQVDQSLELSEQEEARADASEKQLHAAWARIERLESALQAKGEMVDDAEPTPSNWESFALWCDTHFAGRLALTPSARRGLKKSVFEDIACAANCIRWLAVDARERFMTGGGSLANISVFEGISNAPCGTDEYNFDFQGRRLEAKWHFKNGGNTRHPERCLRIYYAYDQMTRQIIIADMPSHRPTGAS